MAAVVAVVVEWGGVVMVVAVVVEEKDKPRRLRMSVILRASTGFRFGLLSALKQRLIRVSERALPAPAKGGGGPAAGGAAGMG